MAIPDITDTEKWIVTTTLRERFGRDVPFDVGDAEIRLNASDRELSNCPVVHWQAEDGCHFVVMKTGERSYRCQFFYRVHRQFGTGVYEYDDLTECVVSLLQAQADHAAEERGDLPSKRR
ncbi:MAG: hypothetical protein MUE39_06190 [Gammaproteobacteria bacterium]|jgi:hypothetical protein|nr:hypothetical protein [Gammaproteobacteria bacterium]